MRRLEGKPVDRAPNLAMLMAFAARHIGETYDRFCRDYRVLVEANVRSCRDFGIDMVNAQSDAYRETADLGGIVEFPYDEVPRCKEPLIKEPSDLKKLRFVNPVDGPRMLDRIKAIELYKQEVGAEFAILGWVEGPFAEAADLRGVSRIMMDFYDHPSLITDLMDFLLELEIAFAREQVNAGAHFIGVGDAAASLLRADIYRNIVLPYEGKLIDAIHEMGARVKLHICGNINHLLDDIWKTNADIIDIDWMVDLKTATEKFKGKACVNGNFDPVAILLNGKPEDVKHAVFRCLAEGDNRLFVSAGCEVPVNTPEENLMAQFEALKEAGAGGT